MGSSRMSVSCTVGEYAKTALLGVEGSSMLNVQAFKLHLDGYLTYVRYPCMVIIHYLPAFPLRKSSNLFIRLRHLSVH